MKLVEIIKRLNKIKRDFGDRDTNVDSIKMCLWLEYPFDVEILTEPMNYKPITKSILGKETLIGWRRLKMKRFNMPSLFDIDVDSLGVLRMPFTIPDYDMEGDIFQNCQECLKEFPRKELKELMLEGVPIFYCKECWFASDISKAKNWKA